MARTEQTTAPPAGIAPARRERVKALIDPGLREKVALITGAISPEGIGAATARAFSALGAAVFLTYLRVRRVAPAGSDTQTPGAARYFALNALPAGQVVDELRAAGGRVETYEIDLADPAAIPDRYDRAERAFGQVDVLVNNAAHCVSDTFRPEAPRGAETSRGLGEPLRTITAESHDRHFAVNSRAVALLVAEYARRHVDRGARWGRIINLSTDAASCFPEEISYAASKYALESYSHTAAAELGDLGITVNIIAPGPIQTGYIPAARENETASHIPLGRVGRPDDVADVIVFLASDQARWVTGQKIYVGGGKKMPP
jgi:3-oxoacyl-[acyl-carrier protein] reductase